MSNVSPPDDLPPRLPDGLPRCPTYNHSTSVTYQESRPSDHQREKETLRTQRRVQREKKVCDIGWSTPKNASFSLPNQCLESRPSGEWSTPPFGRQNGLWLPDPSEVFEAAATIAEGDGCTHADANTRALAEIGFASWDDLAAAHADRIRDALDRLPPPCDATGARLLKATHRILDGPQWPVCVAGGWPLSDVFGVAEWTPQQRRDVLGLVPAAAFAPKAGRKLEAVTETGATFRDPDSRQIAFRRPSLTAELAGVVVWWECPVLINAEAA